MFEKFAEKFLDDSGKRFQVSPSGSITVFQLDFEIHFFKNHNAFYISLHTCRLMCYANTLFFFRHKLLDEVNLPDTLNMLVKGTENLRKILKEDFQLKTL